MGEEAGKPHVERPQGATDADELLAAARAEAEQWRELAERREANLRELKRRPLVRLALRLERQARPLARRLGARSRAPLLRLPKAVVLLRALPMIPLRGRRRRDLSGEVAHLPPVLLARGVSIITFEAQLRTTAPLTSDATAEVQVLHAATAPLHSSSEEVPREALDTVVAALDRAAVDATTELLCFAPAPISAPERGWLARLAAAIEDDVVAATPTTVHPERSGSGATEHDLRVRAQGYIIELGSGGDPSLVAAGAGARLALGEHPHDVAAAPLQGLVVDTLAYRAAGGLDPTLDQDAAATDLCARLGLAGGRVVHVPSAVLFDPRPVESVAALRHPVDPTGGAWRSVVERHGQGGFRNRPSNDAATPSWVITTAAPSARVADRWGDWHLAEGLARALRRLGHAVRVQTLDQADSLAGRWQDVHIVLHGLASVRRTNGQRHIIWVISHPETVDTAECEEADLVVVASPRFAKDLQSRITTPVEVLLQATDPGRFRPQAPDPRHAHPVTVVAKTRDVMRRSVADAIEAGIRPAIYGTGWRDLVDADLISADHVDNRMLAAVYSSAGVVLNDHWDTMREWGFVSNRIFDVLACATPVISDDMSEVRDLFGDAVATYGSSEELGELVRRITEDPGKARATAQQGRKLVLEHHTFDHRAQQLVGLLEKHPKRDIRS
ncbi:MAG: glycosyltransferase family protein [Actinomycetota bacterium]